MIYFYSFIFLFIGFPPSSHEVKVNMQGSLSLGKEVMDTLTHFVKRSNLHFIDGRRALALNNVATDTISLIVNSAFLCRDLKFRQGSLPKFLNEYIIMLTKTMEKIFEGLLKGSNKDELENKIPKGFIFEDELKKILPNIKKILNRADKKLREDDENVFYEAFVWTDLIKRINAKFQETASSFASDRLQGNPQEISEVKKKLVQKIVIESTLVELQYGHKLCVVEGICIKSYEVTKALHVLLKNLQELPDAKTKAFIKYFYETLPDTSFYHKISEVTSNEFQAILNDMAYAENIHTKNVLLAVQKTVEERLDSIESKTENSTGRDIRLVHVILSDMDHFYSLQGVDPFHRFMEKFYEWTETVDRFSAPIRKSMKDIANTVSLESEELVSKLTNEVKVFLEITVDPEN